MQPLNSTKQKNPFMYHSAFKLSIYYHSNPKRCQPWHSLETTATIQQIKHGKIKEIAFDRRQGYQYCIDFVNSIAEKIHSAMLWDALEENICLSRFTQGKWRHIIEPDFSKEYVQISKQFSIHNGFIICKDLPLNASAHNQNFMR